MDCKAVIEQTKGIMETLNESQSTLGKIFNTPINQKTWQTAQKQLQKLQYNMEEKSILQNMNFKQITKMNHLFTKIQKKSEKLTSQNRKEKFSEKLQNVKNKLKNFLDLEELSLKTTGQERTDFNKKRSLEHLKEASKCPCGDSLEDIPSIINDFQNRHTLSLENLKESIKDRITSLQATIDLENDSSFQSIGVKAVFDTFKKTIEDPSTFVVKDPSCFRRHSLDCLKNLYFRAVIKKEWDSYLPEEMQKTLNDVKDIYSEIELETAKQLVFKLNLQERVHKAIPYFNHDLSLSKEEHALLKKYAPESLDQLVPNEENEHKVFYSSKEEVKIINQRIETSSEICLETEASLLEKLSEQKREQYGKETFINRAIEETTTFPTLRENSTHAKVNTPYLVRSINEKGEAVVVEKLEVTSNTEIDPNTNQMTNHSALVISNKK